MKTAPKLIFLFKDADGFAASISYALQPNPSSNLRRLEDSFDLSLVRYGIKDCKASGDITHFVDDNGIPQVSILLLQNYEPPVLACVINEVIASLAGENEMSSLVLILPFFLAAPNLNLEGRSSSKKKIIYGIKKGSETDMTNALATRTQSLPASVQIHHESLSCILQFVHVLNLHAFILIGQSGQDMPHIVSEEELEVLFQDTSHKASAEELEVICEIGEILASVLSLRFLREKIAWNPTKSPKENEEPWRALYG